MDFMARKIEIYIQFNKIKFAEEKKNKYEHDCESEHTDEQSVIAFFFFQ